MTPGDDAPRRLHSVADVARQLSLHPQTVYRLAREHRLPMRKIGGQWLMTHSDLIRLIEAEGDESA